MIAISPYFKHTLGHYFFFNNTAVTTISSQDSFFKISGATTVGSLNEMFDSSSVDNRSTYEGFKSLPYKITATLDVFGGTNQQCTARVAVNGVSIQESQSQSTLSGNGRAENIVIHAPYMFSRGDYAEIYIANNSNSQNFTIENLHVIIERLT